MSRFEKNKYLTHIAVIRDNTVYACSGTFKLFSSFKVTTQPHAEANSYDVDQVKRNVPEILNNFNIHFKFGCGTFGSVYVGSLKRTSSKLFALKYISPCCSPKRIQNEIECLSVIESKYVITLETFIRHNDHTVLVMPFFEHDYFQDYVDKLRISEIQLYMLSLFSALEALHACGIIHRDIKPSNVLFNRKTKSLKLIDFGLSHKVSTGINLSNANSAKQQLSCSHKESEICNLCTIKPNQAAPRAGTSGFRAFEMLLKCPNQSSALDIWSAGVIFLCLLSAKYPFFRPKDDTSGIMQIVTIFGSQRCIEAAKLLGKQLYCSPPQPSQSLTTVCQQLRLARSVKGVKKPVKSSGVQEEKSSWIAAPPAAYELLEQCLNLNSFQRITATQAMTHLFLTECTKFEH